MTPATRRRIEILAPPGFTVAGVALLVVISTMIESIPWLAQPCSLRETTGLPCLACGGTRTMQAIASGDLTDAARWNPLIFIGACAAVLWFGFALRKVWRLNASKTPARHDADRSRRRIRWWLTALSIAAVANWFYLWKFLPT